METRTLTGCFYLWLLLSVDPINAARVKALSSKAEAVSESQELVAELQKALQEEDLANADASNATAGWIKWTGTTCKELKVSYESAQADLKTAYNAAKDDEEISVKEMGKIMLKVRASASAMSRAAKSGCEWLEDGNVDKSSLEELAADASKYVPCKDAAQAVIQGAKDKELPKEEQSKAVMEGLAMLFSDDPEDCKAADISDPAEAADDADGSDRTKEEQEEKQADDVAKEVEAKILDTEEKDSASLVELREGRHPRGPLRHMFIALFHIMKFMILLMCLPYMLIFAVFGVVFCAIRSYLILVLKILTLGAVRVSAHPAPCLRGLSGAAYTSCILDTWFDGAHRHGGHPRPYHPHGGYHPHHGGGGINIHIHPGRGGKGHW